MYSYVCQREEAGHVLAAGAPVRCVLRAQRRIDPADDLPIHEIDVHAIAKPQARVIRGTASKRRPKIVPVGRTAGIALCRIGLTPHKQEGFRAHAYLRPTLLHGRAIPGIEGLEALHEPNLTEIGSTLRRAGFPQVGMLLHPSHPVAIESKFRLLGR